MPAGKPGSPSCSRATGRRLRTGWRRFDCVSQVAADASVIEIDIPIGLLETDARRADAAARGALTGRRKSSVFTTPVRAAVEASTYEAVAGGYATRGQQAGIRAGAQDSRSRGLAAGIVICRGRLRSRDACRPTSNTEVDVGEDLAPNAAGRCVLRRTDGVHRTQSARLDPAGGR